MSTHETWEFNLLWQNDREVYYAVLEYVRELLARSGGKMTDQTLGRNVKDRVFSWAYGGGWGHADGWGHSLTSLRDDDRYPDWHEGPPPAGYRANPFSYFLSVDKYRFVDEVEVGEAVREAFDIEESH